MRWVEHTHYRSSRLDSLTKSYIYDKFEYQFAIVASSKDAYALEMKCRSGKVFGVKPLLNPA